VLNVCHSYLAVRRFDAVVHFAGRKAVGESVEFPMLYYTHNIVGAVNLIEAMRKHGVRNVRQHIWVPASWWEGTVRSFTREPCLSITVCRYDRGTTEHRVTCCSGLCNVSCAPQMVFSSSCTVYGNPQYVPLDEAHPLKAVSPYGRSKLIIEDMFRDLYVAEPEWRIILLRYFNPVGAHPSGQHSTLRHA